MPKLTLIRTFTTVWAAGIAVFSLLPAEIEVSSGMWDKVEHDAAFAGLAVLMKAAWPHWTGLGIWIGVSCALIELGQLLSPGRYADPVDAAADVVGALSGLGLARLLRFGRRPASTPDKSEERSP